MNNRIDVLAVGDRSVGYYPVRGIDGADKLPYSLRILLENVLRNVDDADARESEAPAVEPEFESGDAPDDDAANDEDANDDSPADVEAAADADPSSEDASVIDDDLEDDGPAQGAHFGKPRDDR